jgi:probable HAF family extracellular repeat protein
MRAITSLGVALTWILSATAWAAPPLPKYALIEIPSIVAAGGTMSASAINDRDEVVGNATQSDGAPFYGAALAFFYQHGSGAVNQLTLSSQTFSYAGGINDKGLIAGYVDLSDGFQAVLWSSTGGAEVLEPSSPMSMAMAVNKDGTVVGSYDCPIGGAAGCASMWSGPNHVFAALPLLPIPPSVVFCVRQSSNALAINNHGHIVGWANSCGAGAVEWQDGNITLLAPDGDYFSVANALNDRDEVVGISGAGHAFLYRRGALSDLGTLPGDETSSANAINEDGEIVGVSVATDGVTSRAFIYLNGQMYDLNSLIPAGSVKLEEAVGINSYGWIAANGTREGQQHAYLLTRVQ